MVGRRNFALAGIGAVTVAAMGQVVRGQESGSRERRGSSRGHRGYSQAYMECAEACSDCQRECLRCAGHCANMLAQGHEDHKRTLETCLDCAKLCEAAADIVSRGGPFANLVCNACADACRRCGEECRQHRDDPRMEACAEECFKCEKECRNMTRQGGEDRERESSR